MEKQGRLVRTVAVRTVAVRTVAVRTVAVLGLLLVASGATGQVIASLEQDQSRLQGTSPDEQLLLYTVDPVSPGSSLSHWDTSAFPNLLMEPFISGDLPFRELDVTPAMLQDIGWQPGTSELVIREDDSPGQGFNDTTAFAGAPGNDATTLGEARTNLVASILDVWAGTLHSSLDIEVVISWEPLDCVEGEGAVLASAGAKYVYADSSFPVPDVWYPAALAEALAGRNLTPPAGAGGGDIQVLINSNIDNGCLAEGSGFYYGLDGNRPNNRVDLVTVLLHELAHGLGMANFTNEGTGEMLQDRAGIYDIHTLDSLTGKTWNEMSNEERVASAISFRRVVWTGGLANDAAAAVLEPGVRQLRLHEPGPAAGVYEVGEAQFGPTVADSPVTAPIACLIDEVEDETLYNGCTEAVNAADLAGKIALLDRGGCYFVDKVANAQAAGAIAAVIINRESNTPINMSGTDASITIPSVTVGKADGDRIRQAVCPQTVPLPAPRQVSRRVVQG